MAVAVGLLLIGVYLIVMPPAWSVFSEERAHSLSEDSRFSIETRVRYATRAIELAPDYLKGVAVWRRGRVYFDVGRFADAARDYEEAVQHEKDPSSIFALDLSRAERKLGNRQIALNYLTAFIDANERKQGIKEDGTTRSYLNEAYMERAGVLEQLGNKEGAASDRAKVRK